MGLLVDSFPMNAMYVSISGIHFWSLRQHHTPRSWWPYRTKEGITYLYTITNEPIT